VRITYNALEGEGDKKFESEVSSHKRSAGPESKASTGTSYFRSLLEGQAWILMGSKGL